MTGEVVGAVELEWTSKPFDGLRKDFMRRKGHYRSDWQDGMHVSSIETVMCMFFTIASNSIALGAIMHVLTGGDVKACQ